MMRAVIMQRRILRNAWVHSTREMVTFGREVGWRQSGQVGQNRARKLLTIVNLSAGHSDACQRKKR